MTTKLCRDCRHSGHQVALAVLGAYAMSVLREEMACMHDLSGSRSLVTGARRYHECAGMRNDYSMPCGPDAVLWEAPDAQDS